MTITKDQAIKTINEFNNLETFSDQIDYLREKKYLKVMLDNDCEDIAFNGCLDMTEEDEANLPIFDDFKMDGYFGNEEGVFKLFEYLGIIAENV